MSLLPTDTIKWIGEFAGIAQVKDDVATALAQDVEYRLREIIQESLKFMRHSKRTKLTTADINSALRARNVEKMYGFASNAPLHFKHVPSSQFQSLFYVEDEELDFDDILNAPLPKVPAETSFTAHWLAIEGVQPSIPQNPAPIENKMEALSKKLKAEGRSEFLEKKMDIKPLVKHVLSKELQLYFEKIVMAVLHRDDELRQSALASIAEDNGIQQLLPYFIQFITDQLTKNMKNLRVLQSMLFLMDAIFKNPHFFVEPYLHQMMPPILSCLVAKCICEDPSEDHWSVREMAAKKMALICSRYGNSYQTLQPRVTRTLLRAFLDPQKSLTTHFGAIIGLSELGADVIKVLLIPNMDSYLGVLRKELEETEDEVRKEEANKCFEALVEAAALYAIAETKKNLQGSSATGGAHEMDVDIRVDLKKVEHGPMLAQLFGDALKSRLRAG